MQEMYSYTYCCRNNYTQVHTQLQKVGQNSRRQATVFILSTFCTLPISRLSFSSIPPYLSPLFHFLSFYPLHLRQQISLLTIFVEFYNGRPQQIGKLVIRKKKNHTLWNTESRINRDASTEHSNILISTSTSEVLIYSGVRMMHQKWHNLFTFPTSR